MSALVYVRFECDDPPTDLSVLLGAERPDVSSGYGGWEEVTRPKRTTVTTWAGQPARRLSLSVLFDNFVAGRSVEVDLRVLERLALPRPGGQPPTVKVSAPGGIVPPFYEGMTWVVDALSWGDALMNAAGNRVRQAAVVTLLQYISDDLLAISPAKKRRAKRNRKTGKTTKKGAKSKRKASGAKRNKGHGARSAVVTFDGEDLLSVAARELGDANRWHEIAALNGIRDPRAITRAQVIRLP
jgi:hypothetical protein